MNWLNFREFLVLFGSHFYSLGVASTSLAGIFQEIDQPPQCAGRVATSTNRW
jgi:hypothetical protein